MEIAQVVAPAFTAGPQHKADLLSKAVSTNASPGVINALRELPDTTFAQIRELWPHLDNIPVEA